MMPRRSLGIDVDSGLVTQLIEGLFHGLEEKIDRKFDSLSESIAKKFDDSERRYADGKTEVSELIQSLRNDFVSVKRDIIDRRSAETTVLIKNLNSLREEVRTVRTLFGSLQSKSIPSNDPRGMENTAPAAKRRRMVISWPTANPENGNKRGLSEVVAAMKNNGRSPTCVMEARHKVRTNRVTNLASEVPCLVGSSVSGLNPSQSEGQGRIHSSPKVLKKRTGN